MEYATLLSDGVRGTGLLDGQVESVLASMPLRVEGRVVSLSGLTVAAADLPLPVGALCRIHPRASGVGGVGGVGGGSAGGGGRGTRGGRSEEGALPSMWPGGSRGGGVLAEVVGFEPAGGGAGGTASGLGRTLLMPLTPAAGVAPGDRVESVSATPRVWCSPELLGRVLNGLGEPIDGRGPLGLGTARRIDGRGVAALARAPIDRPIGTSVRAIDALHTCGLGQRMGIFSGPGVGKSTLLAQIARHTSADVSVIALVGERGREVLDFVHETLGPEGLRRCVVVVATSDDPPLLRMRAAKVACTVAEYFRDAGRDVLLLMDSLTRLAQAQRQIGLAAGEPPTVRGYPPSVFAMLPELLERAGRTPVGSITGFYTVLMDGDDFNEPIADAVKGITDGHLLLSRALASRGHFPAIDVNLSISRVRGDVAPAEQVKMAIKVLGLCAVWNDIADLVNLGAYQKGASLEYDLAVESREPILRFLRQEAGSPVALAESQRQLGELYQWICNLEQSLRTAGGRRAGGGLPPSPGGPAGGGGRVAEGGRR